MTALKNIASDKKILLIIIGGIFLSVLTFFLFTNTSSNNFDGNFENLYSGKPSSNQKSILSLFKEGKKTKKGDSQEIVKSDSSEVGVDTTIFGVQDEQIFESSNCGYRLAKIYSEKRLYEKSNKEFVACKAFVGEKFADSVIYFMMQNYWNLSNFDKVMELSKKINFDKILEARYIVDRSKFELAINQNDTASLNRSLKVYAKKIEKDSLNYELILTYAYLLYKSGADLDKTYKFIEKASSLNKRRDFYPYLLKGLFFLHKKEYVKSAEYFNKLTKNYPYNYIVYLYLGKSYFAQKDYKKALENFEISLSIMKTDVGFYNRGITFVKLGNDSLAFEMFKNAFKHNSKNVDNLFEIVKIYAKNDKIDKAILLTENIVGIIKENYGKLGTLHKKYLKFLIKLYLQKDTELFKEKAEKMVYDLCDLDPKDHESLQMYEDINREIFRVKD